MPLTLLVPLLFSQEINLVSQGWEDENPFQSLRQGINLSLLQQALLAV